MYSILRQPANWNILSKCETIIVFQAIYYLHTSSIEYHGEISRRNCLLDNRLVLKLAYFRTDILPRMPPDFSDTNPKNFAYVTYAPEQLRSENIFPGSREADVYSYGHVLAEVLCEVEPFQTEIEVAQYTAGGTHQFFFHMKEKDLA